MVMARNMDASITRLSDQIQQANQDKTRLQVVGNQSKVPRYEAASAISVADYSGILTYDPAELTITVKAGTTLAEINAVLAEQNQMLGFEPPEYGQSTIGGTYACALTGPSRPFRGVLRDYVLGTKMLDGQGRFLQFGGKMIKNVAGYDVSRMLSGSKGSMALVTELSFKVIPLQMEYTYCIEMPENEAIQLMNKMAGTSLPLSACAYYEGKFFYRVAGEHPKQTNRVEVSECSHDIWKQLNPFCPTLKAGEKLWRLDVEGTNPAIENTIAVGMCGQRRWVASPNKPKHQYVTLWQSRFAPRNNDTPEVQRIKAGLKSVFDPNHVFQEL